MFSRHVTSLVILFLVLGSIRGTAAAEIIALPHLQAQVEAIPGWAPSPQDLLDSLSVMVARGVAAHAAAKGVGLKPGEADARILAIWSNPHPNGDNPNVLLQSERIWGPAAGKTGSDFIALMSERCALFAKHRRRVGEVSELTVGDFTFFCADFENRRAQVLTRQEYIATVRGDEYVVFVLSYNDKSDADYLAMRAFVQTFEPAP